MFAAVTRKVSPHLDRCELTQLKREPIHLRRACEEHRRYEDQLVNLGCQVHSLPPEPDLPDSVFVEDTAVVFPEIAVITRPGAPSRRPEIHSVANALAHHRPLEFIDAPATLDGGDVLCVGKEVFVGLSTRSNSSAIDQLRRLLQPYHYAVEGVTMSGCLHLKSAVSQVAEGTLLVNREWVDCTPLAHLDLVEIDPAEPRAANALLIDGHLIYSDAFPRTRDRLEALSLSIHPVDVRELAKAEAGVTCCSLILKGDDSSRLSRVESPFGLSA